MDVAGPAVVQPLKVPVSKPPLTMPPPVVAGVTVSAKLVLWVAEAPVPVTVSVYVPAGVPALVLTVMVDELPLVTEVGLKLAAAPLGRPEALRGTLCAEPDVVAVLIVELVLAPWVTEPLL